MTAHRHAEMIKAKADNDDLVVFEKQSDGYWKIVVTHAVGEFPKWYADTDYFVCLEKHKKACKYWLNGGDAEYSHDGYGLGEIERLREWDEDHVFMDSLKTTRIKPRTEKRWIAVKRKDPSVVYTVTSDSLEGIKSYVSEKYWKFIEIEVEVQ